MNPLPASSILILAQLQWATFQCLQKSKWPNLLQSVADPPDRIADVEKMNDFHDILRKCVEIPKTSIGIWVYESMSWLLSDRMLQIPN